MPPRQARGVGQPQRPRRGPSARGLDTFGDAELLAELGGEGDDDAGDSIESHEELEARLMRELAAMPDAHAADERALLASINAMDEEPDEGDLLMAQLLREEEQRRDALVERRSANAGATVARATASSSTTAAPIVDDASPDAAKLRAACTAAKHEAVRLKRAGDMKGARDALRRAKDFQARAEAAVGAAATQQAQHQLPPPSEGHPDAIAAEDVGTEQLREAVAAAKKEAVNHKRAGDMDAAREALRRSKELQGQLDALSEGKAPAAEYRSRPHSRAFRY